MGADLDLAELHVKVLNYATKKPYIDSSGLTTIDLPYSDIEINDVMFEAKVGEISTAKITLASLIAEPGLRPLLQLIQEGDRVELYNFQPDCGDPVIAGFIPSNGIDEQDGHTILTIDDTLGQLRWQHIRRAEFYNFSAGGFYGRAMEIWRDLVNEDFLGTNPSGDYTVTSQGAASTITWGNGFVQTSGSDITSRMLIYPTYLASGFTIAPGDVFLMDVDCTLNSVFNNAPITEVLVMLGQIPIVSRLVTDGFASITVPDGMVAGGLRYLKPGTPAFFDQWADIWVLSQDPGALYNGYNQLQTSGGTKLAQGSAAFPMPQTHHLQVFVRFDPGSVAVYLYMDGVQAANTNQPWIYDSTKYTPMLLAYSPSAAEYAKVTSWRCMKLVPALLQAGRFNPQTPDAVTYQPNHEENLQLLQLFAEKDNAEYRPIYHAWPAIDELELDQVGMLGKRASQVLAYEQPPKLPTEGSPQVSPAPVIQDAAAFLVAPPFRFEEGFNLQAAPRIQPKANAHANDVIRMGSSTLDSQAFAEKWSTAELGRPQHSPTGMQFPRFEQITNDDRVGLQSFVTTLATYELTRRTDGTPSLELLVVDEVPWAFRWRAGDFVFVKTLSLRNNLEQEMRVMKVQHKAGSPLRTVTVGKTESDPTQMRMVREALMMSWLYDQSGTNPGIYAYPNTGSLASGASSADFTIPLDQFTTGSSIVYAAMHWFADANVMNLIPVINGGIINVVGVSGASGTDSGLVICNNAFQQVGNYTLHFKNFDANPRTLTGAFLILRLKA